MYGVQRGGLTRLSMRSPLSGQPRADLMTEQPAFDLEITGDVVERQELLNRTQIVTLEGAGDGWTFVGDLSWKLGPEGRAVEGDITLTSGAGDELFASLSAGTAREAPPGADADHLLALEYEIDGGSGAYAGSGGGIQLSGRMRGDTFAAGLSVTIGNDRS